MSEKINKIKYIDFNDKTLPIGKRKQAYIKFAVSKGTDILIAKRQANKKFGFEKKPGIFAIVTDYGRMCQNSFRTEEIFDCIDLRKYERADWSLVDDEHKTLKLKKEAKEKGWDVINVVLTA